MLTITKRNFESLTRSSCDRLCLAPAQKRAVVASALKWFDCEKRNIPVGCPINEFVFQVTREIAADCGLLQ